MLDLNVKELDLLNRIDKNPELLTYFFRKVKDLKWFDELNRRGYFSPGYNPKPEKINEEGHIRIPYWPALDYLVKISEELRDIKNTEYAEKVLQIIRDVTNHAKREGFSNHYTWWEFSKVIRNISINLIKLDDIALVDYWFDDPFDKGLASVEVGTKWLPDLLKTENDHAKEISVKLIDVLYRYSFKNKSFGNAESKEALFRIEEYHLKEITDKITGTLGQALGENALNIFENMLINILAEQNDDTFSSVIRRAIEDHQQNRIYYSSLDILITCYRDCLLSYLNDNPKASKAYLRRKLQSEYQTIRRICIYVVGVKFDQFSDLIDSIVIQEHFSSNFRHELWNFLNLNYQKFETENRKNTLELILNLKYDDVNGGFDEEKTAFHKAIWLSSIKDYDVDAEAYYNECITITGAEPEHPNFAAYSISGWVKHESPIPLENLLTLRIDDLVNFLLTYDENASIYTGTTHVGLDGLIETLKTVVQERASELSDNFEKFEGLKLCFIYTLIDAYHVLWLDKAQLKWESHLAKSAKFFR
jgi:hypothetical protein